MKPSSWRALSLCLLVGAVSCKTSSSASSNTAGESSPRDRSQKEDASSTRGPARAGARDLSAPRDWSEFAAPTVAWSEDALSQNKMFKGLAIPDRAGAWRCSGQTCDHFTHPNKVRASVTLPCPLDWGAYTETSPDGTHLALECRDVVHVIDLQKATAHQVRPLDEPYAMDVDDRGVLTIAYETKFERVSADRKQTFEVDVPAYALNNSTRAELHASSGRWLGHSHGAYAEEVAWLATDPPKRLKLGGGAIVNRDTLWVSLMDNGYTRYTEDGNFTPVNGAPKGGAPPHGILIEYTTWGAEGMAFVYERAAFLFDRELVKQKEVLLPEPLEGVPSRGTFVTSPSGDRAYMLRIDGSILVRAID